MFTSWYFYFYIVLDKDVTLTHFLCINVNIIFFLVLDYKKKKLPDLKKKYFYKNKFQFCF